MPLTPVPSPIALVQKVNKKQSARKHDIKPLSADLPAYILANTGKRVIQYARLAGVRPRTFADWLTGKLRPPKDKVPFVLAYVDSRQAAVMAVYDKIRARMAKSAPIKKKDAIALAREKRAKQEQSGINDLTVDL
jgi:hypothetical protein